MSISDEYREQQSKLAEGHNPPVKDGDVVWVRGEVIEGSVGDDIVKAVMMTSLDSPHMICVPLNNCIYDKI